MNSAVTEALAIEYSWPELLQIAGTMRREMARKREIESMFSVLSGAGYLEDCLYWCYQRRLADARDDREACPQRYAQYAREQYARLKADKPRYEARLAYKSEHKRKVRRRTSRGYARGERSGGAKLTVERVRYILTSPLKGSELARELNVSPATISGIRSRQKWAHVSLASQEGLARTATPASQEADHA